MDGSLQYTVAAGSDFTNNKDSNVSYVADRVHTIIVMNSFHSQSSWWTCDEWWPRWSAQGRRLSSPAKDVQSNSSADWMYVYHTTFHIRITADGRSHNIWAGPNYNNQSTRPRSTRASSLISLKPLHRINTAY